MQKIFKKDTNVLICKRKRLTDFEKLMVTKRERDGGKINLEVGINIYTLL